MGVRLEEVTFAYPEGAPVLKKVSTFLDPGEAVALLGPNGAGKTTLTKLIVGLLQPDAGVIRVGDWETTGRDPAEMARRVGYVFQHPDRQLFARTVLDEVSFGPRQLGMSQDEVGNVVRKALDDVGLREVDAVHPYDLPPAEQKLLCFAAALAQRPKILVLDEPTQGFDRPHLLRIAAVVRRQIERGVAVLAVTHDLTFVAEAFDRACVLQDGELVGDYVVSDFLRNEELLSGLGMRFRGVASITAALGLIDAPIRIGEAVEALRRVRQGVTERGSLT